MASCVRRKMSNVAYWITNDVAFRHHVAVTRTFGDFELKMDGFPMVNPIAPIPDVRASRYMVIHCRNHSCLLCKLQTLSPY